MNMFMQPRKYYSVAIMHINCRLVDVCDSCVSIQSALTRHYGLNMGNTDLAHMLLLPLHCEREQLRMETVTLLNPDYELDKFTVRGGGFDQLRKYTPVSSSSCSTFSCRQP
jgi:hypothetical protein